MQRYWENKMKNFDKILLYRFGHWFLVFYQDAERCNKHIDLHIPPKLSQTYLGFHEKWLEDYIDVLVTVGYKVAICEQVEDGEQMQARIAREMKEMTPEERRKVNKTVMREVQYIYSKGTHFKVDADQTTLMGDYDAKYVLAFYQHETKFGYCYFDMSTLSFFLGAFQDDFTLKRFRTLILTIRPVRC